jgi:hypothetical protein
VAVAVAVVAAEHKVHSPTMVLAVMVAELDY